MTLVAKAMSFVSANLLLVSVIAVALVLIYLVVKYTLGGESGPNPFADDTSRPPEPLVMDLSKRDKVLKQGKILL